MGYGVPGNIQIRYFMGIKIRYNAIAFVLGGKRNFHGISPTIWGIHSGELMRYFPGASLGSKSWDFG